MSDIHETNTEQSTEPRLIWPSIFKGGYSLFEILRSIIAAINDLDERIKDLDERIKDLEQ